MAHRAKDAILVLQIIISLQLYDYNEQGESYWEIHELNTEQWESYQEVHGITNWMSTQQKLVTERYTK